MVLTRSKTKNKNALAQDLQDGRDKTSERNKTKSVPVIKTPKTKAETFSHSNLLKQRELTSAIDEKLNNLKEEFPDNNNRLPSKLSRRLFASSIDSETKTNTKEGLITAEATQNALEGKKIAKNSYKEFKKNLCESKKDHYDKTGNVISEEVKELFEKVQFVLNRFSAIIQRADNKRIFLCDDDFSTKEFAIVSLILYFLSEHIGIRVYGKNVFTEREKKLIMRDRKSTQNVLNFLNYLTSGSFSNNLFLEIVFLDKSKSNSLTNDNFLLNPLSLAIDHDTTWDPSLMKEWLSIIKQRYLEETRDQDHTKIFRAEISKDLIDTFEKRLGDEVIFDNLPLALRGLENTVTSTADLTSPHYVSKSKNSSRTAVKMTCPSEFVTPTRKPLILKNSSKIETLTRSSVRRPVLADEIKSMNKENISTRATTSTTFWENLDNTTKTTSTRVHHKLESNSLKSESAHARNLFRVKTIDRSLNQAVELSAACRFKLIYDIFIFIKEAHSPLINKKELQKQFKRFSVDEISSALKFLSNTFKESFSLIETKSGGHILQVNHKMDSVSIMNYLKEQLDQSKRSSKSTSSAASSSTAAGASAEEAAGAELAPAAKAASILSSVKPRDTQRAIASR